MRSTLAHAFALSLALLAFVSTTHAQNPNAAHIFCSNRDGDYDVYLRDASGTLTNLTNNAVDDITPTLSPDGKRIAFARDTDGDGAFQIFVLDLATRATRQLTASNSIFALYPAWSPDSSRIAYMQGSLLNPSTNPFKIFTLAVNQTGTRTAAPIQQTFGTSLDITPAWSPDSSQLVFSSNSQDANFELYLLTPRTASSGQGVASRLTFFANDDVLPA